MTSFSCVAATTSLLAPPQSYAPAIPLSASSQYFDSSAAIKYWALAPHFVRQQTDCSCSVAATTVILNTALARRQKSSLSQDQVLASDTSGHWARATAQGPDCTGVDLDALALLIMRSFYAAGLKHVGVDVHRVFAADRSVQQILRHQLTLSESSAADHFMVINFRQRALVHAGDDVGHMSLVTAFDQKHDRVLIYDVDNRGFEPYWVGLGRLAAAMNTQDDETGEPRGYLMVRLNR